jgi:hypothetical protein
MSYESATGRNQLIDRVTSIGPGAGEEGVGCRVEVRRGRILKQVVEGVDNFGCLAARQTEDDGGGGEFRGSGCGPRCEGPLCDWRGKSAGGKRQGNKG